MALAAPVPAFTSRPIWLFNAGKVATGCKILGGMQSIMPLNTLMIFTLSLMILLSITVVSIRPRSEARAEEVLCAELAAETAAERVTLAEYLASRCEAELLMDERERHARICADKYLQ